MPFLSSFGTNSARNYGQRARQPQLVQLSYTSNATFVVPSGVTSLSISGRGASGSYQPYVPGYPAGTITTTTGAVRTVTNASANWVRDTSYVYDEPYASRPLPQNSGTASLGYYNTVTGNNPSLVYRVFVRSAYSPGISDDNPAWTTANNTDSYSTWFDYIDMFIANENTGSYPRTSTGGNNVTIYNRPGSSEIPETYYTGDSATGFGYTFPGGYGGTADVYSYTKSVSFGQSYSLAIPNTSSYISVSYYV